MKRLLLILALLLAPTVANAQCNGVFGASQACGSVSGGPPGPIPFSAINAPGGTNGQTQYNNGGVFGGYTPNGDVAVVPSTGVETIQPGVVNSGKIAAGGVANSNIAPGAANTFKGSLNGSTTSDISLVVCSAIYQLTQWVSGTGWQCTNQYVLPSRTIAASLNLSAFTSIETLGYATAGDGGRGQFVVTVGTFRDSYTTNASVTANGGTCTNGTYNGVYVSGGTGVNFQGNITVAGGNATLSNIDDYGGNGYTVNDVLTVQNGFVTGCQPQITVSAVTTPLASFTDAGATKWQYIPNNGPINPLAFGCKFNWTQSGGDAGATDDTACVRAVMAFASYSNPNNQNFTDQPFASNKVLFPAGTSLLSTTSTAPGGLLGTGIIQPVGVVVEGAGPTNTIFKVPNSGITSPFWNLCDPNKHVACFGTLLRDVGLSALTSATFHAGVYLLYSNADQQLRAIDNVLIYDGVYGCFRYDTGFGGAATLTSVNFFCTHQNNNQDGIVINANTTIFEFNTTVCEGASTGTNCIDVFAGHVHFLGLHSEGVAVAVNVNSAGSLTIEHATGGNGCTNFVTLQSTNTAGNFAIFDAYKNGCTTNLVLDGQPGGANRAADAVPANGWVSFNP